MNILEKINGVMRVKDIVEDTYLIDSKTNIQLYGYDDKYICYGNWYQDHILDQFAREIVKLEYLPKTNCCKITIDDRESKKHDAV